MRDRIKYKLEKMTPVITLIPSVIVIIVFVYGFIAFTGLVSLSNWGTLKIDLSIKKPLFSTFKELFLSLRFQSDIRNTIVFTLLFLFSAIIIGLVLAILLERNKFGSKFFRNIYIFPYALSFIVTGVVWRWIFTPSAGINALFQQLKIDKFLSFFGIENFKPAWITNPRVVGALEKPLSKIIPYLQNSKVHIGIPLAIIPVVVAAVWQLSGFAMAIYIASLNNISSEIREAAMIDGANVWQYYTKVIFPMLRPATISISIILLHVSLKIFDLVFAMSGVGPGFATDVPGIFVYSMTFQANRYNLGASAALIMLLLVAIVIVPYLFRTQKEI